MIECNIVVDPPTVATPSGYRLPDGGPLLEGGGEGGGLNPENLQSAYKIPTTGGSGETVALVDAYGYKSAESDLAKYREKNKLAACTKASGCFKQVNEKGEEKNYPAEGGGLEAEWSLETSLDMDMVSAACPNCKILLVEASTQDPADTAASVEEAAKLKATEISNSYGYPENNETWCPSKKGCKEYLAAYDQPGIPVTVSAGDSGYDDGVGAPSWPTTSPNVIAVGGTGLKKAENSRGWSEKVWTGSGSGCSLYESKPTWQKDKGCVEHRTDNDVAADASYEESPVAVYNTPYYVYIHGGEKGGWINVGGTSVSSPFIAGVEAHATSATKKLGAEAFYKKPSMLFHISEGSNGSCGAEGSETYYLCHATKEGYNGPTGMGTPDGVFAVIAPSATTGSATNVTTTGATLTGTVNPNGLETTYHFEYGTTTSYGTSIPVPSANIGSGESKLEESKAITGLLPSTIYHFRITATNSVGTTNGEDHTFTTLTPAWRITSTPNPSETLNIYQYGVSCTASNACTSVGQWSPNGNVTYKPLTERWNGTEWSLQTIPVPTGTEQTTFQGVSCASSTTCMAVGYYESSSGVYLSLTEIWNGTEWKIQSTAEPTGTLNSLLHGVSCTSSTACTAVGWYENSSGVELPWAERWNGTAWSVQSTPTPTGAKASYPFRVSCSSATACTMVGYYTNSSGAYEPFAEGWSGTEWSVQSVPAPTGGTRTLPLGVSCTSSSACTMVGSYKNSSGTEVTLAERWNGTEWSVQSTPNPTGATVSELLGVSCTSTTACTAAGLSINSSGKRITLAEHWNGTEWQIQSTPNDAEGEGSLAGGVSCSSLVSCAAVGEIDGKTLAEIYG